MQKIATPLSQAEYLASESPGRVTSCQVADGREEGGSFSDAGESKKVKLSM